MKKLIIFTLCFLSGSSVASTIEQSLDKSETYRSATIATLLFMCSKQYPDNDKLLKEAALFTLIASGNFDESYKIGTELIKDSGFVYSVKSIIKSSDGNTFCLNVAKNITNNE